MRSPVACSAVEARGPRWDIATRSRPPGALCHTRGSPPEGRPHFVHEDSFRRARDFLVTHRDDYETARREFRWPALDRFNWALDYFDAIATGNDRPRCGSSRRAAARTLTFAELAERSNQVANFLRAPGRPARRRVLMMLGNVRADLGGDARGMKLGAGIIPATTLLTPEDLIDRFERGGVRHVVADAADAGKFDALDGEYPDRGRRDGPGWTPLRARLDESSLFTPDGPTDAGDPLLLYFTSGTTAKPKLVVCTPTRATRSATSRRCTGSACAPGDVHLNISSPGWAKHAWSNVFAPWNAGATVFIYNYARFNPRRRSR